MSISSIKSLEELAISVERKSKWMLDSAKKADRTGNYSLLYSVIMSALRDFPEYKKAADSIISTEVNASVSDRVAKQFMARSRKAGGTNFLIKSLNNYQRVVERNLPKWFVQTGDYAGEFVKGSVEWGKWQNEVGMIACAQYFRFRRVVDGQEYEEDGKVQARFEGKDINIQVLLYT